MKEYKLIGDMFPKYLDETEINIDMTSIKAVGIDDFAFKKNILMELL